MFTLNGLSGRELSKALIRNKDLRNEYKIQISKLNLELKNQILKYTTCLLANDSTMHYILAPSTYEAGSIQLTTFIRDTPHSHNTYTNVDEMLKDNQGLLINSYEVTEGVIL